MTDTTTVTISEDDTAVYLEPLVVSISRKLLIFYISIEIAGFGFLMPWLLFSVPLKFDRDCIILSALRIIFQPVRAIEWRKAAFVLSPRDFKTGASIQSHLIHLPRVCRSKSSFRRKLPT